MNAIALGCVVALGLLLFGLGMLVSVLRFQNKALSGSATNPADSLYKVIRAHGNTAEYVAFFAALFLYLGSHAPAGWVLWVMVVATVCRYLVVAGLIFPRSMHAPNPLRFLGALGTYACGIALCIALTTAV